VREAHLTTIHIQYDLCVSCLIHSQRASFGCQIERFCALQNLKAGVCSSQENWKTVTQAEQRTNQKTASSCCDYVGYIVSFVPTHCNKQVLNWKNTDRNTDHKRLGQCIFVPRASTSVAASDESASSADTGKCAGPSHLSSLQRQVNSRGKPADQLCRGQEVNWQECDFSCSLCTMPLISMTGASLVSRKQWILIVIIMKECTELKTDLWCSANQPDSTSCRVHFLWEGQPGGMSRSR
jgi:hypothetical protein